MMVASADSLRWSQTIVVKSTRRIMSCHVTEEFVDAMMVALKSTAGGANKNNERR
jgi:hypothetical protein